MKLTSPIRKAINETQEGMQLVLGEKAFYLWFYSQSKVTRILADTVSTAVALSYLPTLAQALEIMDAGCEHTR